MALLHYTDTPLLFVNSTDSATPNGRNVRVKSRVQLAASHASTKSCKPGDFAVLDFRNKRPPADNSKPEAKRIRGRKDATTSPRPRPSKSVSLTKQPQITRLAHHSWRPLISPSRLEPHAWPRIQNPSNVLVVAAFHIRRMTSNALKGRPELLTQVLRFRQWSCVPTAIERFGTSACLDSALACLALKLNRMTGGTASYRAMLLTHTQALHQLQLALDKPHQHELRDLFTATQLLAVFEMLDSLDNEIWLQHVAGAASLLLAKTTESVECDDSALYAGIVVPMITDALLSNNISFLRQCDWRSALRTLLSDSPSAEAEMGSVLIEALQLILDTNTLFPRNKLDPRTLFDLLDRAHSLKYRLQTSLKNDVCVHHEFGKVESFDKLALCVAELLALDRLVASFRPQEVLEWDSEEGKTSALCAQLLHMELNDADANPATELLSAFQLTK